MTSNWQKKKLGNYCDLQNGFGFKSKDYISNSNTMNFRMSQIRPGGGIDLNNNPKYLPDTYSMKYKDYLLNDGDIVIAMTDMAAETKILGVPTIVKTNDKKLLLNQRVGRLCNIDKKSLSVPFLRYMLSSPEINNYYKSLGRGGLQINIGKYAILNAAIPVPPIPEQNRIVIILDEAFAAIDKAKANAEKNRQNSQELLDSFLNMFFANAGEDWEEKTLGDVCTTTQGVQIVKSEQSNELLPNHRRYLYISDFKNDNNLKYVKNNYPKKIVTTDDIIVVNTGNSAGDIFKGIDGILSNNLFKVSYDKKTTNSDFIYYFVTSTIFRNYQIRIRRGTANPHMGHENFNSTPFCYPKLAEQQAIVQKLDAISTETKKLENIFQKKIIDLEELEKSVLQKAFSGELITKPVPHLI